MNILLFSIYIPRSLLSNLIILLVIYLISVFKLVLICMLTLVLFSLPLLIGMRGVDCSGNYLTHGLIIKQRVIFNRCKQNRNRKDNSNYHTSHYSKYQKSVDRSVKCKPHDKNKDKDTLHELSTSIKITFIINSTYTPWYDLQL